MIAELFRAYSEIARRLGSRGGLSGFRLVSSLQTPKTSYSHRWDIRRKDRNQDLSSHEWPRNWNGPSEPGRAALLQRNLPRLCKRSRVSTGCARSWHMPCVGLVRIMWAFAGYVLAVILIASLMILVSHFLGERHQGAATAEPYESGIAPTGSARIRISTKFYLVAIGFLIFDLEAIFIFAWAIAAPELGWPGYRVFLGFLGVLAVALIYEWRMGILDWGKLSRDRASSKRQRQGSADEMAIH